MNLAISLVALSGCTVTKSPLRPPQTFTVAPQDQRITAVACRDIEPLPKGNVLPMNEKIVAVYLSMANGTTNAWNVEINQIFAETDTGRLRIALNPDEAMREVANPDTGLAFISGFSSGAVTGATIGAAGGGAIGGGLGAALSRSVQDSATIGGAAGGILGAIAFGTFGGVQALRSAKAGYVAGDPNEQLKRVALSEGKQIHFYRSYSLAGYLYYPAEALPVTEGDKYSRIRVVLFREDKSSKEEVPVTLPFEVPLAQNCSSPSS